MVKYGILTLACAAAQALAAPMGQEEIQEWMQRSNGVYSLHEAVAAGDTGVLEARLREGADANQRNEQGITPLHLAVARGDEHAVRRLLQAGADCMAKDAKGHTPLALANGTGIKAMLQEAAADRAHGLRVAELIVAGDAAALEAIQALADPDTKTEDGGMSLLALAIEKKQEEFARALVERGADPDFQLPDGRRLLHLAVETASPALTALLLRKGADPWAEYRQSGFTPLHFAIYCDRADQVEVLLPYYKNCNFNPGPEEAYPVVMAVVRKRHGLLKLFLEAGMDPNSPMFRESPLVIAAARQNDAEALQLLLDSGADRSVKDKYGKKAADYAKGDCAALLREKP